MLTEHIVASVGPPTKAPDPGIPKDASIFLHEFQPLCQQRQVLKKSATPPNCLAISPSHIFAAQTDKGVVHVYSREKGNHEATIPFPERLSSVTLACNDSVLILGTVEGRIFLWETFSGRQITTTQTHLQAVTALAVDATQNFLLSASKDSTVNVWSIPSLLSFSRTTGPTPLRTFSNHREGVTSLVVGHSSTTCNFAVSASRDRIALIWDYRTGNILRTYLLPGTPLCLDLDPADRAVYVGFDDGTLQLLDLYASPAGRPHAMQNGLHAAEPVQPPASSQWKMPDTSRGAILSLSVSFDGTIVISGHHSGSILLWDVARGSFVSALTQADLPGPVNNLSFLPVTGLPRESKTAKLRINEIVKPKFGAFDVSDTGSVPGNYALNVVLASEISSNDAMQDLQSALTTPCFPTALLDQGLAELVAWGHKKSPAGANAEVEDDDQDYMALDSTAALSSQPSPEEENKLLRQQLEALRRVQKKTFEKMDQLSEDRRALLQREQARLARKSTQINGNEMYSDEDSESNG